MKKVKLVALAFALVLALALPAMAEQVDVYENNQLVKSVVFKIGVPEYVVNGQTPGVKMDVSPFIESDRTYVPVRFLGNALGISDENINWNGEVQRAFIAGPNKTSLVMTIGVKEIMIDSNVKAIDVAPLLRSDRTFLPARFVAEGLGYDVGWDEATQTVVCWPAGQPKPDVSGAVEYLVNQNPIGETYTTRAGYKIPKETKLNLANNIEELGPGNKNRCELDFNIDLTKGDLESQWEHAAYILNQKLDSQTVSEMMAHVKQKTNWDQIVENRFWETAEKKARTCSNWGSYGIQITVWYK